MVETWTQNEQGIWHRWRHPGLALDALSNDDPRVACLLAVGDPEDDDQLFATLRLARRLAVGPLTLIAASEQPSARWVEAARRAGANRALLLARRAHFGWRATPPLDNCLDLGDWICPALHSECRRQVPLSVCGRHRDRLVLARHHLERWCVAARERCPHWQGVSW